MSAQRNFLIAGLLALALSLIFLLYGSGLDTAYVIPRRLLRLGSIVLAGLCIGLSSVIFQSLLGNRILTPAIMGYEAVYLMFQALLILLLGSASLITLNAPANAAVSIMLMLGYSWALHHWLLRAGRSHLYLLLVGLVLSMVLSTFTQFIQLRISPGEFSIMQSFSQAGFNRVPPLQLLCSALLVLGVCLIVLRQLSILDVLALGREQALSLGVDHQRGMRLQLALIAVLVAVSTSLVGPTAFMGVFIANTSYMLAGSMRHRVTLPLSCVLSITLFLIAQLLVEHLFNYRTTVGILVNLVCGTYFLVLMLRPRDST
ncbi:iron chelate uptake ABC transporter family permease subunit [Pseudomonas sp. NCCP-436]|uniref:iron chelate uptake ABC transporter family permease subunit n=1 Tax=Pseudomonas sp. NCCP-436 TaxID=2842481 RepID=UPI001C8149E0|nr:iron chelate uptake ABC transporter family permease subunit [Pseudomonas sp. NCCP-436]GIZ12514.1 iron ABC transporter permease [Pseudomonas sp. NCCP-436]